MNTIIKEQVLPLVGKVKWSGFNRDNFGSLASLSQKLIGHTNTRNKEKIKMYLALCIQEWPNVNECPIDKDILIEAIAILE